MTDKLEPSGYTLTFNASDERLLNFTYVEAPRPCKKQPRTYCYPFQDLNLTAFEAKVADQLCSIESANRDVRYQLDHYHHQLKGITIASLVLNAVTVSCILIYLLYSLYSYYRRSKKAVAI
ncbi:hypothetical protein BCR42DRAFT_425467 [Absidia repens]|uniref:Uncharacterized protein n=1 Tax=Absidia repens TaxID=90262 RepID=A0A1X2I386_9FUNG|nr:hypothetical protein BCR42DRAFT_425467 [Absidia repens]